MVVLIPLVILTVFFGVYPKPIFDVTRVSVANLIQQYNEGIALAQVPEGAAP
jgi:NADH-quinone oxidoreductase subunit M